LVKKKDEKPRREVTKRQLSRWRQQKKRQRFIFGLGTFIIVSVLGIVGAGWYIGYYQPLHQTVIKVNDVEFNMNYYVKMIKLFGEGQSIEIRQFLADGVITRIERNELIRQGAMKLGISVGDDEVDAELKSREPPLSKDYRDIVRADMLVNKLLDEHFDQQVPVFAEQRHIMAMFLESESQVTEVKARLESGEDFGELAGELSLESFSQSEEGDFDWHPEGILTELLGTSIPDDYAFNPEAGVLSQPIYEEERIKGVGYWIAKVLEREEEKGKVRVLGILLSSEEEAQKVREKLEAGEDFDELAEEFSQDEESKDDGGKLGWFTPGEAGPAFDEFTFNPEIELGVISEPILDDTIATKEGYWLIKVVERKESKIEAHVQAILLGSEEEAQQVKSKLEAGGDFAELAEEFSQDDGSKDDGGRMGWFTPGEASPAFDEFVFNFEIELETLSELIKDDTVLTEGGYWLVKVLDEDDNRRIDGGDRDLLKAKAFDVWVSSLWDDPENKVESYLGCEKEAWAAEQSMKG